MLKALSQARPDNAIVFFPLSPPASTAPFLNSVTRKPPHVHVTDVPQQVMFLYKNRVQGRDLPPRLLYCDAFSSCQANAAEYHYTPPYNPNITGATFIRRLVSSLLFSVVSCWLADHLYTCAFGRAYFRWSFMYHVVCLGARDRSRCAVHH